MSRTQRIAVCTIWLIAAGAVCVEGGSFESMQRTPIWGDDDLPPALPAGMAPDDGTWEQLNSLMPAMSTPWGERLATSFQGFPGLWLYENGTWENLTSATPSELLVACRSLIAAFPGHGLFLHNGEGWTRLHNQTPAGLEAWGNERLLVNFGPGVGFWNYTCPVSVTCGFLDGTTWNLTHADPDVSRFLMRVDISGHQAVLTYTQDGCGQEPELFTLMNGASSSGRAPSAGPTTRTAISNTTKRPWGGSTRPRSSRTSGRT